MALIRAGVRLTADLRDARHSGCRQFGLMIRAQDPYEQTDWDRRRDPRWLRRGLVFELMHRAGGQFDLLNYARVVHAAGYAGVGSVSGFLRGEPEAVVERSGDDCNLTDRGRWAARFWRDYWLPKLRAGQEQWPT